MSSFKKAEKKRMKLRLGIAGPAGSGKTFSALKIAKGLGKKIAVIDTEHGSSELYSHLGEFDVAIIEPEFTPKKYVQLIKEAGEEYDVIIIDSLSHAWAGEGGILDIQGKLSVGKNSYTAWRDVTPMHNALVEAMLQSPAHIIATLRSKQDYVIEDGNGGKKVPKKVGMAPVQRDGMEYEFTVFFEIDQQHNAIATKDRTELYDGKIPFVPSEKTGDELLIWLNTGAEPPAPPPPPASKLFKSAYEAAWGKEAWEDKAALREYVRQHTGKMSASDLTPQDWELLMASFPEQEAA